MNVNYLIPANSKKSMLILGFFTPVDLIIFGAGSAVTLALLMTIRTTNIMVMVGIITPALIAAFLVLPVPNYHNMLQLITNVVTYFSSRRKFYWKGWDYKNEQ